MKFEAARRLNGLYRGGAVHRSQGALVSSSRRSLGLSCVGLSRILATRLNDFSDNAKPLRSSSPDSASGQAASSMKSGRLLPSTSAARSIVALCCLLACTFIGFAWLSDFFVLMSTMSQWLHNYYTGLARKFADRSLTVAATGCCRWVAIDAFTHF